ncbi:MAG: polyhydroxyalkanoate synthesis repressor [Pseudomonadota bacterium]|jgi:polyhydroxyalkanoate synthesis repressor PhaR
MSLNNKINKIYSLNKDTFTLEVLCKSIRLIKKYPNRRLYDTKTSTYITLEDIRNFVVSGEKIQVVDAKTGENLTRSVYLNIVLEAEAGGEPLFTEDALICMIRFYGNTFQGTLGSFLEKNIRAFLDVQTKLQEQNKLLSTAKVYQPDTWVNLLGTPNSVTQTMVGTYLEHNKQAFSHMQEALQVQTLALFTSFGTGEPSKSD